MNPVQKGAAQNESLTKQAASGVTALTFAELKSGAKVFTETSVRELFDLASVLAVQGDLAAKNYIYEQFIALHPQTSEDDLQRVVIHRADLARREGRMTEAFAGLMNLEISRSLVTATEYLQALAQCHLYLHHLSPAPAELRQALQLQNKLLTLALGTEVIPLDKQLYYFESLIAMKVELLRTLSGSERLSLAAEITVDINSYQSLAHDGELCPEHRRRSQLAQHLLEGEFYKVVEQYAVAAAAYLRIFIERHDDRLRTIGAVNYLFCAHFNGADLQSLMDDQCLGFLRERTFNELLQTDRAAHGPEIKWVREKLLA